VWKQIRKNRLAVEGVVDVQEVERTAAAAGGLTDEELGRRLFQLTAAARERGLDPEGALRRYADGVQLAVEGKVRSETQVPSEPPP
jgi:XTP/dITP diphosphohydrolase/tetrapyrrole methylase family protein/MazG family protein